MLQRRIGRANRDDIQRLSRPVVLGDPFRQFLASAPVRFIDHVEGCGECVGMLSRLRQQPHPAFGHGDFDCLLDFRRRHAVIGHRPAPLNVSRFHAVHPVHESVSSPSLPSSLNNAPLTHAAVVGRVNGLSSPHAAGRARVPAPAGPTSPSGGDPVVRASTAMSERTIGAYPHLVASDVDAEQIFDSSRRYDPRHFHHLASRFSVLFDFDATEPRPFEPRNVVIQDQRTADAADERPLSLRIAADGSLAHAMSETAQPPAQPKTR